MSFLVEIKFITEDSNQIHKQINQIHKLKVAFLIGKYIQHIARENQAWYGLG
jgi:hypothetical protein